MVAIPSADDATHQLRELVRTGHFGEALEWYRRIEGSPTGHRPDAQLLAATAATRIGEFPLAESLAGQALVKFRARGDADGRMRALNLLGVIRIERGRLGEAEVSLAEALDLARRLGDSLTAARACNNLASARHLRGYRRSLIARARRSGTRSKRAMRGGLAKRPKLLRTQSPAGLAATRWMARSRRTLSRWNADRTARRRRQCRRNAPIKFRTGAGGLK